MPDQALIRTVASTGSTNVDMAGWARSGAADGSWLRAETQTAGRGRQGRAWTSPAGNLYSSNLVRLRPNDPPAPTLALAAAVALEDAIGTFLGSGTGWRLKWPNDLLLDGAKLSGILLERADDAVVIGIGVNLAHHPDLPDRRTTSLFAQDVVVSPTDFLDVLAEAMARWVGRWRSEGLVAVRTRWLERAHPPGTALTARLSDERAVDGLFEGLDADGALILRLAGGERRVIHAADVFLI